MLVKLCDLSGNHQFKNHQQLAHQFTKFPSGFQKDETHFFTNFTATKKTLLVSPRMCYIYKMGLDTLNFGP